MRSLILCWQPKFITDEKEHVLRMMLISGWTQQKTKKIHPDVKTQHQNQNIWTADALWNLHVKNKWKETIQQQASVAPSFHCILIYLLSLGCLFGSYFIKLLPSHLKIMPSLNWASLHCIFMIPKCYLSIQSSNCKLLAIRTESNNKNCK